MYNRDLFEMEDDFKGEKGSLKNQTSSFIPLLSQFISGFILGLLLGKGKNKAPNSDKS